MEFTSKTDIIGDQRLIDPGRAKSDSLLAGFVESFAANRIGIVQFEYGPKNIVSKFLLMDFYRFFERHNMVVGKIFPTYVDFRNYELSDENFYGPNYLAVRREHEDVIERLGKGGHRA